MSELLIALFRLFNPWLLFFERKAEDLPGASPDVLYRRQRERERQRLAQLAGDSRLRRAIEDRVVIDPLDRWFVPGDPLPDRVCTICGSEDYMMDEQDRCWHCNEEIRREEAINNRADERGQRY